MFFPRRRTPRHSLPSLYSPSGPIWPILLCQISALAAECGNFECCSVCGDFVVNQAECRSVCGDFVVSECRSVCGDFIVSEYRSVCEDFCVNQAECCSACGDFVVSYSVDAETLSTFFHLFLLRPPAHRHSESAAIRALCSFTFFLKSVFSIFLSNLSLDSSGIQSLSVPDTRKHLSKLWLFPPHAEQGSRS